MSGHVCDPATAPGGGPVTRARTTRVLIEALKAARGEDASLVSVAYAATEGCPTCTATLFLTITGMAASLLVETHGTSALMMLELQLAGVEAEIRGGRGDQ